MSYWSNYPESREEVMRHGYNYGVWITGQPIALMSDEHLENAINWLSSEKCDKNKVDFIGFTFALQDEIEKRREEKRELDVVRPEFDIAHDDPQPESDRDAAASFISVGRSPDGSYTVSGDPVGVILACERLSELAEYERSFA